MNIFLSSGFLNLLFSWTYWGFTKIFPEYAQPSLPRLMVVHILLSCTICCIMYWETVYRTAVTICFCLVPNLLFLSTSCGFTKIFPELTRPSFPILLVIQFFFCSSDSLLHFSFSDMSKSELLLVQIYAAYSCSTVSEHTLPPKTRFLF